MTPAKAFRLAVSKASEVELGLAARAQTIKEEPLSQPQLLEALDGEALLLMLEGPHDARGVAIIDMQALSAVIEVQTLGSVIAAEATKRRPTRIDSAMCEAVLDRVLQEFEGQLADTVAADWSAGFRVGKQISSLRLLGMALADIPYRLFYLPLDLADGAKQGLLQIALPAQWARGQQVGVGGDDGWAQAMENAVGDSHVGITGVLHRVQKTLSEVQAMVVGDLIDVPKSAISNVSMEGADGCVVGGARLGQQNGFRALRVTGADAALPPMTNLAGELPAQDLLREMDIPMPEMDGTGGDAPLGDLPDLPMTPMGGR